jgi:hypothetical protein
MYINDWCTRMPYNRFPAGRLPIRLGQALIIPGAAPAPTIRPQRFHPKKLASLPVLRTGLRAQRDSQHQQYCSP